MLKISHQIFFILMESIPYSLDQFKFKKSFFFTFIFKKNHGIFYLRLWLTKDLLFWKHFFHVIDVFFREQRAKLFFYLVTLLLFHLAAREKRRVETHPKLRREKPITVVGGKNITSLIWVWKYYLHPHKNSFFIIKIWKENS